MAADIVWGRARSILEAAEEDAEGRLLVLPEEAVGVVTKLAEGVVGVESQSAVSVLVLSRSELEA